MLRIIAALVLGAILLPAAAALAESRESDAILGASVQTEPLYLGPVNAVQVDSMDAIRDHDHGFDQNQ